jgi:glycosyltransferase involved in cell wall biosynthesis
MTQMQSLDDPCSDRSEPLSHDRSENLLITVLMPCLNESRTLAACVEQAHAGCRAALAMRSTPAVVEEQGSEPSQGYEIVIADNGSSDGSPEIALAHGARVVSVEQKGYGAALLGGIAAARGKYIVMGDSDCSYDFGEVPRFIAKLEEGFDLVVGNRFAGGIMPGAMPWHHRYIGNPVLSGIGRLLYRTPCRDWHCGLRGFEREKTAALKIQCTGMELASEMVLKARLCGLRTTEVPIILYPDLRVRPPHLRSIRDGMRHLHVLLSHAISFKVRPKMIPLSPTKK